MQIQQLLSEATEQLATVSESPRLDAEVLLAFSLKKNRTWLITWPEKPLEPDQLSQFHSLLARRVNGEPVAHITGEREFWSLPLKVNQHTLIPRPETELLVETLLALYPANIDISLADLGTGSGAIAVALASERPSWQISATDKSAEALGIAKENASNLKLTNIRFFQGSWFDALPSAQQYDVIASNPPYIPETDPHLEQGDVRFEPITALASGNDGLDDIRHICQSATSHLKPSGLLIIEHGFDQKSEIFDIFNFYNYKNIDQIDDLGGNPRITMGFKP